MSKSFIFYIRGITCSSCSGIIENVLSETYSTRIELFNVDVTSDDPKKTILILTESDDEDHKLLWGIIRAQIEELGYNCEPYDYAQASDETEIPPHLESNTAPENPFQKWLKQLKALITSHWFQGGVGCALGLALLITMLCTGGLSLAITIPIAVISTLITFALGARSYYDAFKKLFKAKTLTMDLLFAISTLTVIIVSILSFFIPSLPMMFEAGLLIYGFRHIGKGIEESIREKITSAKFQDRAPKVVDLSIKDSIIKTPLYQIKTDDILMMNPGDIIPVDGICMESTYLYNTITTGAILPRHFNPEEPVRAGMRLAEYVKPLRIKVKKTPKESYLARLDNSIEQSIAQKTPLEIKTQKILTYFIPIVLALALLSGIIISFFFPPAIAIQCAISVLVSACPCTLGLIIPLALKTGVQKAAENGIQFKKSKIQDPEQIDVVVLDLNGTLTKGIPTVKDCICLPGTGIERESLLSICNALEKESKHPIGKAIYAFSEQPGLAKKIGTDLDNTHHSGIGGVVDDVHYTIGSHSLMQEKGINTESIEKAILLETGDSLVFIAREQTVIGYAIITDPLRQDAKATIENLAKMGKEVVLCTGADEKTATRYANALGINRVYANRTAAIMEEAEEDCRSKPALIQLLKSEGHKVAMVGDAANDTQALAVSDFGIAILSNDSDELTQQHAGAIIQSDSLLPVASTFEISQQTVSNINQNLFLSFAYNFISILIAGGLLLAVGFTFPPALGVVFMVVQACTILLNVYRFKNQTLESANTETSTPEDSVSLEQSSSQKINQHLPKQSIVSESTLETVAEDNGCSDTPQDLIYPRMNDFWQSTSKKTKGHAIACHSEPGEQSSHTILYS